MNMDLCLTGTAMKQQEQDEADVVKERVKNKNRNVKMTKLGLQGLQAPRPAPLKICKDSHKIPVTQRGPPVIIYTRSPEVIHTQPQDFSKLVQRLTGSTTSSLHKSHRSKMKSHSKHDAAIVEGPRSSHSQVLLEPCTSSLHQNPQEIHPEDFSSHAARKELIPPEHTNINDPTKTARNISVSNNPADITAAASNHQYPKKFLQQILSPFGLHSPSFTLDPSFLPNSLPISPSPGWVLRSSDISPGYTFPLEYSPLFSNFPTDAPFDDIFSPSHLRPPSSSSKNSSSDPFNRIP